MESRTPHVTSYHRVQPRRDHLLQITTVRTMALPTVAAPGQSLVSALTYTAGPGTYVFKEQIRAAAVGAVTLSADGKSVSVTNPVLPTDGSGTVLPDVGSTVLARVTRINPRQATVSIFCVGDLVTGDEFQGIIRYVHVRDSGGWW